MAGSLNYSQLQEISPEVNSYNLFIETGTLRGGTTFEMAPHFEEVHTIELSKTLHDEAHKKSKELGFNNVTFHLGDSAEILPQLLPLINQKAIFFLDGHWSGKNTGRGPKDCPLIEELQSINQLHKFASLIIIDDLRLLGTNFNEDWSDITLTAIHECFPPQKIANSGSRDDRYFILLNE